ncbi:MULTISPECIES: hypothetical protein [Calothrix]|uniref:Uncharacterized protein n=2 Tax=Calothrix TaxID=1186 RepID=A0ABR8A6E4_9CYAN|nr:MULTISPECIES: hypothetical protein [Calothrix]MBD2195557.1 hypothetical protein [Calothrix parietina FACHB-288]MBD2224118.1 hypothetical protein [Calothrix anomala FACHB-343]
MIDEIDQLLADWQQKINAASQNLLELQEQSTYQRLCGYSGYPQLSLAGITAIRVTPALEAMNDLFQYFDLLVQVVEKASKLRQQLPRFLASADKIDEIKQLLIGASIDLPAVHTPLAQRELLSATHTVNAIAPGELLQVMTHAFSVARDAVLAVDEAWNHLDNILADAESQIYALQNSAEFLDSQVIDELVQIQTAIASLRQRVEEDPLGVRVEVEQQIQPMLVKVKSVVEQALKQQRQIRARLAIARDLLEKLTTIQANSLVTFAETQEKIVGYLIKSPSLTPEELNALTQWLTRLETKLAEGLVNPVIIGLENWIDKAQAYIASEQQVFTANSALLANRQELRGRLDALQAKALAKGLIEDGKLSDIAAQAKQILYTRPTALDKAAELVSQYEKRLNWGMGNRA